MTGSQRGMTAAQAWVLALTSAASLMVALDALVVSTALSTIRVHLAASLADLEWTVNGYVLSLAVLLMTGAALGDRLGRRRLFAAGMGLFTAASAACALAPDVGWLIAARAVQGAGAAVMMPLALALLSAGFPPGQRPRALGIFGAVTGLGVVLGPLVGGAVVQGLSWPWIFWLNVPVGLVTIALTRARISESFGPDSALDLAGLLLVTGGVFGIVWALVRGNSAAAGEHGRPHPRRTRCGRAASPRGRPGTRRARWPPPWPGAHEPRRMLRIRGSPRRRPARAPRVSPGPVSA